MTDIRTHGFKTKAELDEHLADIEGPPEADEANLPSVDMVEDEEAVELARLQGELTLLRRRLALIREQANSEISPHAQWRDASAHEQLGNYPWLKLAGAILITFLAARRLRSLPLSGMATMPFALLRFGRA